MFTDSAHRLAGLAGLLFGWAPDIFWGATPAELGALVEAITGDGGGDPPDGALVARMMEAFPDG